VARQVDRRSRTASRCGHKIIHDSAVAIARADRGRSPGCARTGSLIVYVGVLLFAVPVGISVYPARVKGFKVGAPDVSVAPAAANVIAFLLEDGLGPCTDDPIGHLLLPDARQARRRYRLTGDAQARRASSAALPM
jgi:hypothetical protein